MKENVIDAALKELGESTIIDCDMPTGLKVIDHTTFGTVPGNSSFLNGRNGNNTVSLN